MLNLETLLLKSKNTKTLKLLTESKKYYSTKVVKKVRKIIIENVIRNLISEVSIDLLKQQFKGKISEEDIEKIVKITSGKTAYVTWMVKAVVSKDINLSSVDVQTFEEYFRIFNKYKAKFSNSDIGKIKAKEFIQTATVLLNKENKANIDNKDNDKVSISEIEKLEDVGIMFLGNTPNGFQVFKIPQNLKDNEESWKLYRSIIGRCFNREKGEKVQICTIANFSNYKSYLDSGPLYTFFNLSDPLSPYTFHFPENEFKNKNNDSILNNI